MRIARLLPLLALSLAACQQAREPAPVATESAGPDAAPGMTIDGGELVLPAVKGNPGAAYFTLSNSNSVPAVVAAIHIDGVGKTEMHETVGGEMKPLDVLAVPSRRMVQFAPGGKHVMAFDLADSLKPGTTTEMTITFADGDKISAPLAIQPAGSAMPMDDMSGMPSAGAH